MSMLPGNRYCRFAAFRALARLSLCLTRILKVSQRIFEGRRLGKIIITTILVKEASKLCSGITVVYFYCKYIESAKKQALGLLALDAAAVPAKRPRPAASSSTTSALLALRRPCSHRLG
jgi:hypothetical protein